MQRNSITARGSTAADPSVEPPPFHQLRQRATFVRAAAQAVGCVMVGGQVLTHDACVPLSKILTLVLSLSKG